MGLTDRRKTAKNFVDSRKNWKILTVSRNLGVNQDLGSISGALSGNYSKIPKITPELIFFKGPFWGAYIRRGLCRGINLRFKIDWAGL